MNPPSRDAVAQALSILLNSHNEQNAAQFSITASSAKVAPLTSLPNNVEALKLAKASINTELDSAILEMQTRRNLVSPIYKLPVEILVMIFADVANDGDWPNTEGLLELSTVSRRWHDVVIHSPQLWVGLDVDVPLKIAKLVVQRSQNLPLSLYWGTTKDDEEMDYNIGLEEKMALVMENVDRLKSIEMTVPATSTLNIRGLLESNMSHLESLEVMMTYESEEEEEEEEEEVLEEFQLAHGPHFQKLSLHNVGLSSWISSRLSGLVDLEIVRPGCAPSVEEIKSILMGSPNLEQLTMLGWNAEEGKFNPDLTPGRVHPIHLPVLRRINTGWLSDCYFRLLMECLYVPSAKTVYIRHDPSGSDGGRQLLEAVFSPRNVQLISVLGLSSITTPVRIKTTIDYVQISHGDGQGWLMRIDGEWSTTHAFLSHLGQVLAALPRMPIFELEIDHRCFDSYSPLFLLKSKSWSHYISRLIVAGTTSCRTAMINLQQWIVDPRAGAGAWVFPNLRSVRLLWGVDQVDQVSEDPKLDGGALEALVRHRWIAGNHSDPKELASLEIVCNENEYPSLCFTARRLQQTVAFLVLEESEAKR